MARHIPTCRTCGGPDCVPHDHEELGGLMTEEQEKSWEDIITAAEALLNVSPMVSEIVYGSPYSRPGQYLQFMKAVDGLKQAVRNSRRQRKRRGG